MDAVDIFVYLSFLLNHGCMYAVQRVCMYMTFISLRLVYLNKNQFCVNNKNGKFSN